MNIFRNMRDKHKIKRNKKLEAEEDKKIKDAVNLLTKYLKRDECFVLSKTFVKRYKFKSWTELEEKLSRVRLIKCDDKWKDFLIDFDKKCVESNKE